MWDTVKLLFRRHEAWATGDTVADLREKEKRNPHITLWQSIYKPKCGDGGKTVIEHGYGGCLGNLRVEVYEGELTVEGSICKWYKGSNLESLTRTETEAMIKKLSEELGLPMERAEVQRLDFGRNLITRYKPWNYFRHLGRMKFTRREMFKGTVYYFKGDYWKLEFYDKVKEYKENTTGRELPEAWRGKNILRYEYSLLKRVKKSLGLPYGLEASKLYDPDFCRKMIDRWEKAYFEIDKTGGNITSLVSLAKKRAKGMFKGGILALLNKLFGITYLQTHKTEDIYNDIDEVQLEGLINSVEASRGRTRIQELSQERTEMMKSRLVNELDQLIREEAQQMREEI